jgi:Family of unknown function (DUF5519)
MNVDDNFRIVTKPSRIERGEQEVQTMWSQRGKLEEQVSRWPQVTVHAHRFGGREFRFHRAEIGHVHWGGVVDIPFPRPIRDALLQEGLAEEHHWVPSSGWITFRIRDEKGFQHALWLMRLSYLRYALKADANPSGLLERESKQLRLSPGFISLLTPFIPLSRDPAFDGPIPA